MRARGLPDGRHCARSVLRVWHRAHGRPATRPARHRHRPQPRLPRPGHPPHRRPAPAFSRRCRMTGHHRRDPRTAPVGTPAAGTASGGGTAMAGLGRELEALRRDLDDVRELATRVDEMSGSLDELAATVRQLTETFAIAKTETAAAEDAAPSWLDLPVDPS